MVCSFLCCSKCCGFISLFGIFFLFSVGHMFLWQPMFTDLEAWEHHEDEDASRNCLLGAVIYCGTLVASIGCFLYDKQRLKRRPPIASAVSQRALLGNELSGHLAI